MDDSGNLSEKISKIMNDPDSMQQIKALGSMLGLDTSGIDNFSNDNNKNQNQENNHNSVSSSTPFMNTGTSPDVMNSLEKILPLINSINTDNDTTRLLNALRPFLSDKRRKKLDESAKLLTLMRILPLIKSSGLFG